MKNRFYFILLLLIGLIGVKALFHRGFYTSHDGRHQIIRLMHFHQGLVDGQVPVRWAGTALKGYGYPLFIFTYRFPFWIAEVWYLISKNLGEAIKFTFIITYLLSGFSMYYFSSQLWSSKLAGFMAAILYLWAPYRFVNIFVRASLGEAVTFVFIPLIFLGFFNLAKEEKRQLSWIIFTAFSLAGLILSHAIVLGLWLIPLVLWLGLNLYQSKDKKDYLISSALAGFSSLFLTAYYWIPALIERKYVKFSGIIGDYYKAHFVTLKQLIYSKWGYGFSLPGVENDMMSFQIGIAQWVIIGGIVLTVLIGFLSFLKRKKLKKISSSFLKVDVFKNNLWQLIYFLAVYFLSVYLMLSCSEWFYRFVKNFFTIDIPWRFLGISVFSASLLFGGLVVIIKNNLFKWGLISLILFLAFYGNRNHLRVNKYVYLPDSEYWESTETSNEYEDYTPKWFSSGKFDQADPQLVTFKGRSNNKLLERKSNFFRFYSEVNSKKAEIATKVAYYPGWQLFVDSQKQNIFHQDGRIKVSLNKGNHLITLIFQETNLRRFCNWLSLLTLILLIGMFFKYGKKE